MTTIDLRGRPPKALDGYINLIRYYYLEQNYTAKQILELLKAEYGLTISLRHFRTFVSDQGPEFKKNVVVNNDPMLRMRISTCFHLLALEEPEILAVLQNEGIYSSQLLDQTIKLTSINFAGWKINKLALANIRKSMGLYHRIRGQDSIAESNELLRTALLAEYETRLPANYGREYMFRHLSIQGIPVARDRMLTLMKEIDPDGVASRTPAFKAGRDKVGQYLVPGPNYAWCVDGHLKFREYGIGIYATIDGYSR